MSAIQVASLVILLACASPCLTTHAEANLLLNGGFEEGDGGWNGKQRGAALRWETLCGGSHPEIYALDPHVFHSGKFSQRMSCEGYNYVWNSEGNYCFDRRDGTEHRHPAPTELGFQALAQTTAPGIIRPGARYHCSAWVKTSGLEQEWEWFRLGIYWLDRNGKFISESRQIKDSKWDPSHDWRKVHVTGKAPDNAAFAKVYLHHHFVHGTVWYDDVALHCITPLQQGEKEAEK